MGPDLSKDTSMVWLFNNENCKVVNLGDLISSGTYRYSDAGTGFYNNH